MTESRVRDLTNNLKTITIYSPNFLICHVDDINKDVLISFDMSWQNTSYENYGPTVETIDVGGIGDTNRPPSDTIKDGQLFLAYYNYWYFSVLYKMNCDLTNGKVELRVVEGPASNLNSTY